MEQLSKTYGEDTICAISTPAGVGGIAVVRVSGSKAVEYVMKSWRGYDLRKAATHTAHFGRIVYPDGETLDEVVATVFLCPHSFTGEDTVELSCHGSQWIQTQLVTLMLRNGCRAAEGGEFTRRAFMNGKIDLSQAEAIADVIASSSRASHRVAISQMRGGFSEMLAKLREQLLEFVSLMELELDFSEEDVEFADRSRLTDLARHIDSVITSLADSFSVGNAIKNGVPVAIVGETNAGKSTLLNTLLNEDKAIVSDIHGTTRDVIEDTVNLQGITFRFIDTAGIRDTHDTIESMGIARSFQKMEQANIILWVVDSTQIQTQMEALPHRIFPLCQEKRLIILLNKADQMPDTDLAHLIPPTLTLPPQTEILPISAKEKTGIARLQSILAEAAALPDINSGDIVVTNLRHYEALSRALDDIRRVQDGLHTRLPNDLVSQDLRECLFHLAEITGGEITTDEVLGNIFKNFCIGK